MDESRSTKERQAHALFLPFPLQGHMGPMLRIAKLFHSRGLYVTFVHTDRTRARLLEANGPGALDGRPGFRFEAMPDGVPPDGEEDETRRAVRCATKGLIAQPFRALLARLGASGDSPPLTCVVADFMMHSALQVATAEFGLPTAVRMPSLGALLGYAQYEKLLNDGIIPLKDNDALDMVLDWTKDGQGIRLRDIPAAICFRDPTASLVKFFISMTHSIKAASALLFNSFDELERDAFRALAPGFPPLLPIGPFDLLLGPESIKSGSGLWKEDADCLEWLDSRGPGSVVYVNFGSTTSLSDGQLAEFAWGLAGSGRPFLWVIRPGSASEGALPPGFVEASGGRGLVRSWCDQERVLAHPAVGAFLTHCGWNSVVESICNGVPMLCWPFLADQFLYRWYCCDKWGVGLEVGPAVERGDVARKVEEVMEGEGGKVMREKVMELKRLAHDAARPITGSSSLNLDKAIKLLTSSPV